MSTDTAFLKLNSRLWFSRKYLHPAGRRTEILQGPLFSARDPRNDTLICSAPGTADSGFIVLHRAIPDAARSILITQAQRRFFGPARGGLPAAADCCEGINEYGLAVLLRPAAEKAFLSHNSPNLAAVLLDCCTGIRDTDAVLRKIPDLPAALRYVRLFLSDRDGGIAEIVAGDAGPYSTSMDAVLYGVDRNAVPDKAISRTYALDLLKALPNSDREMRLLRIYDCTEANVLIHAEGESYEFSPLKADPKLISGKVFQPASRAVSDEAGKAYRNTYEKSAK